jgi:hypothetical protein
MNRLVGSDFQELMEIKSTMAQNQIKKLLVLQRATKAFKVQLLSSNPRIINLHIKVAGICLISNRREGMQIHLSDGTTKITTESQSSSPSIIKILALLKVVPIEIVLVITSRRD